MGGGGARAGRAPPRSANGLFPPTFWGWRPPPGESWITASMVNAMILIDATMINAKHTVVNDMMLSANTNARTMIHQNTDGDCERHGAHHAY